MNETETNRYGTPLAATTRHVSLQNETDIVDRIRARFMDKVSPEPNSGCWLWMAALNHKGYGVFEGRANKKQMAHRFAFEWHIGPIPEGLELDHLCRVRCCVNPRHLEPVTKLENLRRSAVGIVNRSKTHCPQGHEYTPENIVRKASGGRGCRACQRIHARTYRQRRDAAASLLSY